MDDTVTISKHEHEELLDDAAFLSYLYAAGLDSWEGFALALNEFDKEYKIEAE